MMRVRVLPVAEWDRLHHAGHQIAPLVPAGDADVIVLEDGDRIVGCITALRVPYIEAFWIDPEYRGNLGAVRALSAAAFGKAREWGQWAFAGSADESKMADYLLRLGARPMPMAFFVVPLNGGA